MSERGCETQEEVVKEAAREVLSERGCETQEEVVKEAAREVLSERGCETQEEVVQHEQHTSAAMMKKKSNPM